jgi:hypothetical protein
LAGKQLRLRPRAILGPLSRFRFGVWDAEGACKAISSGHPVTYNTITNDLIVPSSHKNYNLDLPRVFRRLSTSPEFRLLFADRVNRHLFNGGVLDDRDPTAPGRPNPVSSSGWMNCAVKRTPPSPITPARPLP